MSNAEVEARFWGVLSLCDFEGVRFIVAHKRNVPFLQLEFTARDNVTGESAIWRSRKWLLTEHMTDGEIVQTAFKAVLTAQEHEARETFRYRGVTIFDPHYDIEKLVELRREPASIKERA